MLLIACNKQTQRLKTPHGVVSPPMNEPPHRIRLSIPGSGNGGDGGQCLQTTAEDQGSVSPCGQVKKGGGTRTQEGGGEAAPVSKAETSSRAMRLAASCGVSGIESLQSVNLEEPTIQRGCCKE